MTQTIRRNIKDESRLYNPFDDLNKTLSDDVISYIYGKYSVMDPRDGLAIRIISPEEIDMDNVRRAFSDYLDTARLKLRIEKKRNMIRQFWMFAIGVLCIGFGIYAVISVPALPGEIISTIGAFSMWEAASVWIVKNPENRLKRRWLDLLSKTRIEYEKVLP